MSHADTVAVVHYAVDTVFGRVHDLADLGAAFGRVLDVGAGRDYQRAKIVIIRYDLRVVLGVMRRRNGLREVDEVFLRLLVVRVDARRLDLLEKRNEVYRVIEIAHFEQYLIDRGVFLDIEIIRTQNKRDLVDKVGFDDYRAEHRLLRFKTVRELYIFKCHLNTLCL